jgi:phosphatidylserine/phosphatidylglycerophosphate/cardiolipin synthase-like enzyme
MRSHQSCHAIRKRLRAAGLEAPVIDAEATLGEGDALDVPGTADAVRLARVASRMRADGFRVAGIVYRGPHAPTTVGFDAVAESGLAAAQWGATAARSVRTNALTRLDATTATRPIPGNRVEVELENATARAWLLSAIDASRLRVHVQAYMAADDAFGRQLEASLASAAARGVTVRVLVDSLHGLYGPVGPRNPLFERLAAVPGIELRAFRPIEGAPSIEDLKQRDHRKLAVIDSSVALVGGRNLSHEYYTGFGEVSLSAETPWRVVPWLDAGARVRGPAVAAFEASFLEAWRGAGGAPFTITEPPPAGSTSVRVVVHHGLRDAYTLEAYLAMIEAARSHVIAVNGFPLQLEIQHALLRALRRGVRVRTLFGNVMPRHGDEPFQGLGTAARVAATQLVHSRMDALVAAGGECYELALRDLPSWDPALGLVRPHVHAKAMSADGRVCAVGSANLDITAGYWENELLLVVEDEPITRAVEARFEALFTDSVRVDRGDPAWRRLADQRDWLRYWPSLLSV